MRPEADLQATFRSWSCPYRAARHHDKHVAEVRSQRSALVAAHRDILDESSWERTDLADGVRRASAIDMPRRGKAVHGCRLQGLGHLSDPVSEWPR